MSNAPHPLADDPLALAVFERKIRRYHFKKDDRQHLDCEGQAYELIGHCISMFSTTHVVAKQLGGHGKGYQRAMAFVEVRDHGYRSGPVGSSLLMPALLDGLRIPECSDDKHYWYALPWLEVPRVFETPSEEVER